MGNNAIESIDHIVVDGFYISAASRPVFVTPTTQAVGYVHQQLQKLVGSSGYCVKIERDHQGRITGLNDNLGREVEYSYHDNGTLASTVDIGGGNWNHQYNMDKQLLAITDPQGRYSARFDYFVNGKVRRSRVGVQDLSYDYQGDVTTVTDSLNNSTMFRQNAQGLTTFVTNGQPNLLINQPPELTQNSTKINSLLFLPNITTHCFITTLLFSLLVEK